MTVVRKLLTLAGAAFATYACYDTSSITGPAPAPASFEIADAARGYKAGFYWLAPLVRQPSVSGTFDAAVSPTVEICALAAGSCGTVIASYTMTTGSGSERVRVDPAAEHYIVNWHTNEFDVAVGTYYRIVVRAGAGIVLGYADVQPVSTGKEMKNVNTNEYIALVDGRTLPIKFRIEKGIVAAITVAPASAETNIGGTQQFVATLTDLQGSPIVAPVQWSSSDNGVATIDQNGLASAVADGDVTITASAEQVSGTAAFSVVAGVLVGSAGFQHSCALDGAGRAFCWGRGVEGQLGTGTTSNHLTPVAVVGGNVFSSIAASASHTCGITNSGDAMCWGNGALGRLGNGSTATQLTPVTVTGGNSFVSVTTNALGAHTCALTGTGQAFCWGPNGAGALGNGTFINQLVPSPVGGGHTWGVLSAGSGNTCGITTAGQTFCWGFGSAGQLGNGSGATQTLPVPVSGGHSFVAISGGGNHYCAVTGTGVAFCWGNGSFGNLGNGVTGLQFIPTPVHTSLAFASVAAGGRHTCALTAGGAAYCWGANDSGQLGTGNTTNQLLPVAVVGGHTFASLSAGSDHTCGVTTSAQLYCWGRGSAGLGNGSLFNQTTPTAVAPFPP